MRINLLFFLFIISAFGGWTQGGKGVYNWPNYSPISVPDEFSEEPAFYISNIRTLDFTDGNGTQLVVFKRIYINSESAADEYNKMEIYTDEDGFTSVIAARTLKPGGVEIELTESQIIETISSRKNKYGNQIVRRVQFLFPNVEIGDVLDIAYQIDYRNHLYSDLMYLEDDLPSIESKIHLRNSSKLELSIFPLNEMSPMDQTPLNGIPSVSWKKNFVKAIRTDYFNALPPDHPSFSYMLWHTDKTVTYDLIYEIDEGNYPYNSNPSQSITKFFLQNNVFNEDDHTLLKVQKIILYLEKEFSWNYTENTQYSSQTMGFLDKEKIDYTLFFRYLTKFLTENKVHYVKGFTKSLLDGQFEVDFVSLEQISERFLLIYDENENPHFLFPPWGPGNFYSVDETPFYVEENQAICLLGKNGLLDEVFGIKIPGTKSNINKHRSFVSLNVLSDQMGFCHLERKDVLSGHYSFLCRSAKGQNWLSELGIKVDENKLDPSSIDLNFPYKTSYMQTDDTLELLSFIGDSLYWLDLESIIPKGIYETDELTMSFGDYVVLPFKKENHISFFLNHGNEISLAEEESRISFSNEIGEVSSTVNQANPNRLIIEVKIKIKERFIRGADQISNLTELLKQYANIKRKKWIIKLG